MRRCEGFCERVEGKEFMERPQEGALTFQRAGPSRIRSCGRPLNLPSTFSTSHAIQLVGWKTHGGGTAQEFELHPDHRVAPRSLGPRKGYIACREQGEQLEQVVSVFRPPASVWKKCHEIVR